MVINKYAQLTLGFKPLNLRCGTGVNAAALPPLVLESFNHLIKARKDVCYPSRPRCRENGVPSLPYSTSPQRTRKNEQGDTG